MPSVQRGGNLNVYRGIAIQRGRGFGSLLGGLKNVLIPLAKSGLKAVTPVLKKTGKAALRQGRKQLVQVVKDVSRGKPLKQSIVRRVVKPSVKAAQQRMIEELSSNPQQRRKRKRKSIPSTSHRIKQAREILS